MLVFALKKEFVWRKINKLINGLKLIQIAIRNHGARTSINVRLNNNEKFYFHFLLIRFL